MKHRANLSPTERQDVRRLYKTKKFSMRKLADHFGCSKSTIDRIVKEDEYKSVQESIEIAPTPKHTQTKPKLPKSAPVITPKPHVTPLVFKSQKLEEVNLDLHACRMRGQYNVVAALHRLHLSIYDECNQLEQEQKEIEEKIQTDGRINAIFDIIAQFPPVIKQEFEKLFLNKNGRVLTFPKAAEND